MQIEDLHIVIHADGACSGNPGPGGWAATVLFNGVVTTALQGGDPETTNNRMELEAVLQALEYVTQTGLRPHCILLRLDSQYVLQGLKTWCESWAERGWRDARGREIKNPDLWRQLWVYRLHYAHVLEFEHVRGHSGDPDNERVDRLAVAARDISRHKSHSWQAEPELE